jgi:thioredoxin reductase (NADPH)
MASELYDVVIVGGGPAGLSAALYAARDRYKTVILEKFIPGGQIATTDRIENYPGFERISGPDLVERMQKQALGFGAELKAGYQASALKRNDDGTLTVVTNDGEEEFRGRAVILTMGSDYRHLGVPGEEEFRSAGAGVSYCGTCDAPFFKGKTVVAVGGGNTAIEEALHLAKFASKVFLVHRREQFRATLVLVEELMSKAEKLGMELVLSSVVESIEGDGKVERILTRHIKTQEPRVLEADGIFIFIGHVPNTEWLKGSGVELNEQGFIVCDTAWLRTALPGVFVAGDCRIAAAMQLATASADGVVAALMLRNWFADPDWWTKPAYEVKPLQQW